MNDKPKKLGLIKALIISQLIDSALKMMPPGTIGRKELAAASMLFHSGLSR